MNANPDAAARPASLAGNRPQKTTDSNSGVDQLRMMKAPAHVDTPLWNVSSAEERREILDRNADTTEQSIEVNSSSGETVDSQTAKPEELVPQANARAAAGRKPTSEILDQYQVKDDKLVFWSPNIAGIFSAKDDLVGKKVTSTEAGLLDKLLGQKGIMEASTIATILNPLGLDGEINAFRVADQHFPRFKIEYSQAVPATANLPHPLPVRTPVPGSGDGHNDAFRHAFFSAILTKKYGVEFAEAFGTAHEGIPGNSADREAMDLFNNEIGRRIAVDNPNASAGELANLIHKAIDNGEAVVIDDKGELVYSDQVEVGKTGYANDDPRDGVISPPEWNPPVNE